MLQLFSAYLGHQKVSTFIEFFTYVWIADKTLPFKYHKERIKGLISGEQCSYKPWLITLSLNTSCKSCMEGLVVCAMAESC
jgi:hypothetical protein